MRSEGAPPAAATRQPAAPPSGAADPAIARIVEAGGARVPALLARVEERLAEIAHSHGDVLAQHAGATIAAGGKRLRPLLVLLCAGSETRPPADDDALVRAGAAVELVHSATLVHDDVLDAAPLRRGRPTVVSLGGRTMAIATGDLLFSRAFGELAANGSAHQVRALSRASSALARGELLQREDAWNAEVTEERYLERCELKTARLFVAACELGALAGGADGATTAALADFGRRIGLAFQLLDDVLDVAGPPERTGKHRGTDLLDGTVTLPLILARRRDPRLAAVDVRAIRTPEEAERTCDAIIATGALDDVRLRAVEMVAGAKREVPADRRTVLDLVADGVVERYS